MRYSRLKRYLVAAVILGALLVYHFVFFPWWRPPNRSAEEVEQRFRQVARLAEPRAGRGDNKLLGEALERLRASASHGREGLVDRGGNPRSPFPHVAPEQLDPSGQAAIALLRGWHTAGGGFASSTCETLCSEHASGSFQCAIALNRLGSLALATATGEERTTVDAVLHLAHAMRGAGRHAEFIVGTSLAEQSVAWAHTRAVPAWSTFRELGPRAAEIVPAFARERWCALAAIERKPTAAGWFDFTLRASTGEPVGPEPPLGIVRPRRERLVALDTAATAVLAAAAHSSDLPAMSRAVERAMQDAQHVRRTTLQFESYFVPAIDRAQRATLSYEQLLSSGD
jgi:hypothetical protein